MTENGELRTELRDGSILIRQHRLDDVDPHYEAVDKSRAGIAPFLFWCTPDFSRLSSEEWIGMQESLWSAGEEYNFVIEDTESGRFLGSVAVNRIDRVNRTAGLGYWVRTNMSRKGVATAAARLAARFAFEDLGMRRIELFIRYDNIASRRVAEKLGAMREGTLRNRMFLHGRSWDAVMYSILPGELTAG